MALDPRSVRAPEFPRVEWLNTAEPPTLAGLRGRTVLLDLWDFSCINCLHTLPFLRDWHERYRDAGLAVLGIHTPEFRFGRSPRHVRAAIGRLGIRWPVALDNEQEIWTAYANRVWPTVYLIDRKGYIRARHLGEAGYEELESDLRGLLAEDPEVARRTPLAAQEPGPQPIDGVCLPATPELQADSVGNGTASEDEARRFALPDQLEEGRIYLEGEWRLAEDGLSLASETGSIALRFRAGSVHAVAACGPDLDQAPPPSDGEVAEVMLDGLPVPAANFGEDLYQRSGSSRLQIEVPRAYGLIRDLHPGPHELRLHLSSPGVTIYAFSFGRCLIPSTQPRSDTC